MVKVPFGYAVAVSGNPTNLTRCVKMAHSPFVYAKQIFLPIKQWIGAKGS